VFTQGGTLMRLATSAVILYVLVFAYSLPSSAQKGSASPAQPQGGAGQGQGGAATPYFETVMLAHGALNELAEAVAQRVCNASPTVLPHHATVIIYDQQSFQNLGAWQSFATGAEVLADAYKILPVPNVPGAQAPTPQNALTAGATTGSFLLGGADLGSLITAIAASTSNSASTFTIPDSTMAVSLMHQFERINCDAHLIYYPIFGSYADKSSATDTVRNALQNLNDARRIAQENWNGVPAANSIYDASKNNIYTELNDLNAQYDLLLKNFLGAQGQSTGGGGGGGPGSQTGSPAAGSQNTGSGGANPTNTSAGAVSLLQGAELEELIEKDDTYILYADVVAAGGTQRDIKNVFTLFTGDWLSYSGGVVVNVALIKSKETRLEFSDTLRYRSDFHHRDLWDVLGLKTFTDPSESKLVEKVNTASNTATLCNHGRNRKRNPSGNCPVEDDQLSGRDFLTFDKTVLSGGTGLSGTLTLRGKTQAPFRATLLNSDPTEVPVTNVVIPTGSDSAPFTILMPVVTARKTIMISAIDETDAPHSQQITLNTRLLALTQNQVKGGLTVLADIVLPNGAPEDGTTVTIVSSDPAVILSTNSVEFSQGNTFNQVDVITRAVASPKRVVISAVYGDMADSEVLTVNP
jgi:hypothetical protein